MTKKELQLVAKSLNEVLELEGDDVIDVKSKKLEQELKACLAGDDPELDIYSEDEFTDEVWGLLAKLGNNIAIDKMKEDDEEEEEEKPKKKGKTSSKKVEEEEEEDDDDSSDDEEEEDDDSSDDEEEEDDDDSSDDEEEEEEEKPKKPAPKKKGKKVEEEKEDDDDDDDDDDSSDEEEDDDDSSDDEEEEEIEIPSEKELKKMKPKQLRELAEQLGIEDADDLDKAELIEAILEADEEEEEEEKPKKKTKKEEKPKAKEKEKEKKPKRAMSVVAELVSILQSKPHTKATYLKEAEKRGLSPSSARTLIYHAKNPKMYTQHKALPGMLHELEDGTLTFDAPKKSKKSKKK